MVGILIQVIFQMDLKVETFSAQVPQLWELSSDIIWFGTRLDVVA